jgi:hypothetical protein
MLSSHRVIESPSFWVTEEGSPSNLPKMTFNTQNRASIPRVIEVIWRPLKGAFEATMYSATLALEKN